MEMGELLTQRIGILGLGVNNIGLTKWLLARGAKRITICDANITLRHDFADWEKKVSWRLGADYLRDLTQFDVVFRTPGIPYLHPEIQKAKRAGVVVTSQTALFFELSPARIIGVTGTKGKGTTATLIAEILEAQQSHDRRLQTKKRSAGRVYLAGNIGRDPFEFLDSLTIRDWVVLELSSFQLQDLNRSPHIAVVLKITSDHLDHHGSHEEYVRAKMSVAAHQFPADHLVLYADGQEQRVLAERSQATVWRFSRTQPVDRGAYVRWVRGTGVRYGEILLRDHGRDRLIARTYDLKLRGEHNLENVTAAVTAAYLAGAGLGVIRHTVTHFYGLKHRLQHVGVVAGRTFYNDSFATNPEPTIAALKSFSEPVHLIVGGSSKSADFRVLAREIATSTVRSLIPLGRVEGVRIAAEVAKVAKGAQLTIYPPVDSMREAVGWAYRASKPGEVILLSPAAASFDLFPNYKDRGDQFIRAVARLGVRG